MPQLMLQCVIYNNYYSTLTKELVEGLEAVPVVQMVRLECDSEEGAIRLDLVLAHRRLAAHSI